MSIRRRPAPRSTCPSAAPRSRASARTSRVRPRTSSTPRRSRSIRMSEERWLITGALGCIGAWACRQLVREGQDVIAYDLGEDTRRLQLVMAPEEVGKVRLTPGDVTDLDALVKVIADNNVTHVVHL